MALRELPGIGEYTAAAVASFAFGQRHAVLDTNVRRVHARVLDGQTAQPPGAAGRDERQRALELLPTEPARAATASVAVMEFGALCCTAREPNCAWCPVAGQCAWNLAGQPAAPGTKRSGQGYAGTDRQCRGTLLAMARESDRPIPHSELINAWFDSDQCQRSLHSLLDDGLLQERKTAATKTYSLPE
jgi:A/G-specific adenine glycosylase